MGCGASIQTLDSLGRTFEDIFARSKIIRLSVTSPEASGGYRKFLNQDYFLLKAECQKRGSLFEDPTFPPDERSLFFKDDSPADINWLRPATIASFPQLFVEGISPSDFDQGKLGNCWFIASCSCIAMQPWLVSQIIPESHSQEWHSDNNYCGIFHFQFFIFGEWIDVTIDDLLPTRNGKLIYCQSTSKNEFWSALVEKAYAKLFGCYEALKSGMSNNAMEDLTGGVGELITIPGNVPRKEVDYRKRIIFNELLQTFQKHSLINASISSKSGSEEKLANGLVAGHSYSVTDVRRIRAGSVVNGLLEEETIPLVRLRNPWGKIEWKGPWSDYAPEWDAIDEIQKAIISLDFSNDGEFWMHFDDFFKIFDKLYVCHLFNKSLQWRGRQTWGSFRLPDRAGGCSNFKSHINNPQYLFEIRENGTDTVIVLQQEDSRSQRDEGKTDESIGFRIYRANLEDGTRMKRLPGKPVATSGPFTNTRSCIVRKKFKKGRYILMPSTFRPGIEINFLIRIYATTDPMLSEELRDNETVTSSFVMRPISQVSEQQGLGRTARRMSHALMETLSPKQARYVDTTICIHQCRGLTQGKQDALTFYCELICDDESQKTPVYERSFNPAWEHSITFYDRNPKSPIDIIIRNAANDDDIVGVARIKIMSEVTPRNVRKQGLVDGFPVKKKMLGTLYYTIEQEIYK